MLLSGSALERRVAFPQAEAGHRGSEIGSQDLAHLPLVPPAPPEADDVRGLRSNSKPALMDESPSSTRSSGSAWLSV